MKNNDTITTIISGKWQMRCWDTKYNGEFLLMYEVIKNSVKYITISFRYWYIKRHVIYF